jgi:hypothetical protein
MSVGKLTAILILTLLPRSLAAAEPPASWARVTEHADFPPRDTSSGAVFLGKMWMSNGYPDFRDLWSSSDGTSWTKVLDYTPYDPYSRLVVHDGKLWAIKNSVWFSRNGVDWTRAVKQVPFRISSEAVEYAGRMWALGSGSEVWSSANGTRWVCATRKAPFGKRSAAAFAVFDDKLWLLGGATAAPRMGYPTAERKGYPNLKMNHDVWSSSDGTNWMPIIDDAPWAGRMWFVAEEYAGRLWVMGGYNNDNYTNLSDTWFTEDGVHWEQLNSDDVWSARHQPTGFVFKNALWLVAGNSWPTVNDVWRITSSTKPHAIAKHSTRKPLPVIDADSVREVTSSGCSDSDSLCSAAFAVFDMTAVNAKAKGFSGAAFDGRYIYFVPNHDGENYSGLVARYDTTRPFKSRTSWSTFDTTSVNAKSQGFFDAVFDGRYVYFVPDQYGASGQVTRYDTARQFSSPASWSIYDTAALDSRSKGFRSAVFDGRYIYLVPYKNSEKHESHGLVTRLDTTADFNSATSWSFFDATTVDSKSRGFIGSVFDGRYVYLVPTHNDGYFGQVTRYDTSKPFGSPDSWSVFDTAAINPGSRGFVGAVFDGRYVYLVPYNNGEPQGQVTRYDTTGEFTSASSWRFYDTTAVDAESKGFTGAVFDGRYVYFVPNNSDGPHGHLTRYDTRGSFTSLHSWKVYDMTAVNAGSSGFHNAVFDGHYIYFVPYNNGAAHGQVTRLVTDGGEGRLPVIPTAVAENTTTASEHVGTNGEGVAPQRSNLTSVLRTQFDKAGTRLSEISELGAAVEGGRSYAFEFAGFITASRVGGYKFAMHCTCTASNVAYEIVAVDNGTNAVSVSSRHTALGGNDGSAGAADVFVRIIGTITPETSGVLSPQFAQELEEGRSSVLAGSRFEISLLGAQ